MNMQKIQDSAGTGTGHVAIDPIDTHDRSSSVQSVKLNPMWHACNSKAAVRCGTKNRHFR